MEIIKIIKYEGKENYCIGLLEGKNSNGEKQLFVFYCLTDGFNIQMKIDSSQKFSGYNTSYATIEQKEYEINIPIKTPITNHSFVVMAIKKEEDYELIKSVVESLA